MYQMRKVRKSVSAAFAHTRFIDGRRKGVREVTGLVSNSDENRND